MATVKPRIKLDKKEEKKGELVEVKALVQHVMETGNRRDASGAIALPVVGEFGLDQYVDALALASKFRGKVIFRPNR